MKRKFETFIEIPEGVECSYQNGEFECKKGENLLKKKMSLFDTKVEVKDGKISFNIKKANKNNIKIIRSCISHLKNIFSGLEKDFVYRLEICYVHFPMTVKLEGNKLVISNFLGEKKSRTVKIEEEVKVEVKGKDVVVSGRDLEKVGQTAANIENATKVSGRDRRIFQDGIFIVSKKRAIEE
ncbi:50S ribosomal protein L6 [Candidatus Pacearchaeota archaeon CG10_big_fil_rev_8_21_14_0_10_35_219]|nr:MAG: 50S ribosomal protein L6 [Candidatus Pacearchaeota archaeon CG10_big_fil_rev_8_21_14_0_10_35_219]PIZ80195.1 MAG: 50S ribosomal protein L6 [Candidatus Pacearchaeota archaeon CG_4_10_14_0_2_um_filter_35_33]